MSLKDYKLVDKGKGHYIMQHSDGTKFVIAHDGLDESMHQKIQKFADGGIVEDSPMTEVTITPEQNKAILAAGEQMQSQPPQASEAPIPDEEIGSFVPQQNEQQQPQFATEGMDIQQQAALNEGEIQSKMYKKQAAALGQQEAKANELAKQMTERQQEFQAKSQILEDELRKSSINPNQVFDNMNTGQKILAGVSILLGSNSNGPNPVVETLNKIIQRDIDAQVKNIDNKKNMLSMLYEKNKDLNQATMQLRDLQLSAAKVQLEKIAASSNSPLVKAQAAKAFGLIQQQKDQIKNAYAAASAAAQSTSSGLGIQSSNMRAATDEKYAAKRVKVGDRYFEASSPEEAKEIRQVQEKAAPLKDMIKRLDSVGPSAAVPGTEANMKAQALMSSAILNMKEMFKLGVLSESDVKIVEGMLNDPKKFRNFINGDAKSKEVFQNIDNALESEYKSKLSGYKGSVRAQTKPGFSK